MSEETGSYCNGMSSWKRPNFEHKITNPEESRAGTDEHNSCWECEHIQVAGQFNRRCSKHPSKHMWGCGPESELKQREEFKLDREPAGRTTADDCGDYLVCKEMRPEHHKTIFLAEEEISSWTAEKREDFKKKHKVLSHKLKDGKYELTIWDSEDE